MLKKVLLSLATLLILGCGSPRKIKGYELFEFTGEPSYKSENNVSSKDAKNQSSGLEKYWYKDTAFYHIWIKSFYDSNNDGCGDFPGIEQKLDYIKDLGCTGIWLSPFFECSNKGKTENFNMHGYDAIDFYKVNSYFSGKDGTEETSENAESALISLINACHEKGLKIIFDFVPNHTSSQNQWFIDSSKNLNGKRSWYLWSDTQLSWNNSMNTSNFHQNPNGTNYYYGAFGSGMPDLNYRNYEVREEMKNVVRYWLNKGFDGIRMDAVRYLIEDYSKAYDTDETHEYFQELRTEIEKYDSPKFMVCEAWITGNRTSVKKYFGNNNEFNMIFDFDQGLQITSSVKNQTDYFSTIMEKSSFSDSTTYGTFLANHDEYQARLGTLFDGDYKQINLATAISLLRPTAPFIYYGQELGAKNLTVSGDLALRGKFSWTLAETESSETTSPLALNKAILKIRNQESPLFSDGKINLLKSQNSKIVSYTLKNASSILLCVFNLSSSSVENVTFSDFTESQTNFSCIIGDNTQNLTIENNSITVQHLAPYAVRVYKFGTTSGENLFNNEEYSESDYTPSDSIPENIYIPEKMYLRGSFNSWGGWEMEKNTNNDDIVSWSVVLTTKGSGNDKIEYKFCENNGSPWGANWGRSSSDNSNISQYITAGNYYLISMSLNKKTGEYKHSFTQTQI